SPYHDPNNSPRPPLPKNKPSPAGNKPRPPLPKKPPVAKKPARLLSSTSVEDGSETGLSCSPDPQVPTTPKHAACSPDDLSSSHQTALTSQDNKLHKRKTKSAKRTVAELGLYAAGKSLFYVDQSPTDENAPPSNTVPSLPAQTPSTSTVTSSSDDKSEHVSVVPTKNSKTPPKATKRRSLRSSNSSPNQVNSIPVLNDVCDGRSRWYVSSPTAAASEHAAVSEEAVVPEAAAVPEAAVSEEAAVQAATNCVTGNATKTDRQSADTDGKCAEVLPQEPTSPQPVPNGQKKMGPKLSPKPSPKPSPRPVPRPAPKPRKRLLSMENLDQVSPNKELSEGSQVKSSLEHTPSELTSPASDKSTESNLSSSTVHTDEGSLHATGEVENLTAQTPSQSTETAQSPQYIGMNGKGPHTPTHNTGLNRSLSSDKSGKEGSVCVRTSSKSTSEPAEMEREKSITVENVPEDSCDKVTSPAKVSRSDEDDPSNENTCEMLKEIEALLSKNFGESGVLAEKPKVLNDVNNEQNVCSEVRKSTNSLERRGSSDSVKSESSPSTPLRPPRPRRAASQLLKHLSFDQPVVLKDNDSSGNKAASFKKPCPPKPKRTNLSRFGRSQSDVSGMLGLVEKMDSPEIDPSRPNVPVRHQSFSPGDAPPPLPPRNSVRCVSMEESEIVQQLQGEVKQDKSMPPVPARTSIPPGSQAPFAKPPRVRSRTRPKRDAPPPPPGHPPAVKTKSLDQSGSLEKSSVQNKPADSDHRTSKQYRKIEISDSKKTCDVKEFVETSSDKDDSFDHDYHEIGEHPPSERSSPVKEVTPPPSLPPRSYRHSTASVKPEEDGDVAAGENKPDSFRDKQDADVPDGADVPRKDTTDNLSCSSDGNQSLLSSTREEHSDHLDVSTPKWQRSRPVSDTSQLSTNSSGSGDNFSNVVGQDISSDSDEDQEDATYQKLKRARKVFYIAEEIKKSEEVFVDVLKLLNIDFRNHVTKAAEKVDHAVIPSEMLNKILDYLPQLHNFNEDLLKDLTERIEHWKENPKVADIFVKKGPFLKLYSSYIRNFENATAMFEESCKRYPEFQRIVKEFEVSSRCASLALKHYMLKPIQRIPQYKLLLQDYLKNLPIDSPDYKHTEVALTIVSEVADHANESMRHGDTVQKLLEIQHSLIGQFEVIQPGRNLIKHGELQKSSRKELQPRMFYLFNDVLLYTTPVTGGYRLNNILPLTGMKVCTPQQEAFSNEFSIISVQRSFTVAASTPEERDEWLKALTSAIAEITSRRHTFEAMQHGPQVYCLLQNFVLDKDFVLGHKAPLWVPDARVTMCMLCLGEFTITWRRHHCRSCGRVVCGYCSDNKAPLRYLKYKPARVCDDCFEKLEKGLEEEDRSVEPEEDGAQPSRISLKNLKERFQKIRKSGRKSQMKRPAVLKEVRANDEGSVMSGYLRILKNNKKWKKLWFVVKDKVLYTYKASEDMAAIESLPLLGFEVSRTTVDHLKTGWIEGAEPDLVFQLTHSNTQPHIFRTDSAAATEKWLTVMRESSVA
ncbi:LOW QUALITY PROTEIN: FYVE, RhoGEF and PH domain-containing protein 1-like, partial [Haliotis rubra]|uniref:LOW QUALITY PROTEIN: FYVE, RhoGEF and PH domain-containing protein 1-like n=1 Tax=Haliotis rubra TaxID=36100 RepID=UPI001EE61A43